MSTHINCDDVHCFWNEVSYSVKIFEAAEASMQKNEWMALRRSRCFIIDADIL